MNLSCLGLLVFLGGIGLLAGRFEVTTRQQLYADPIVLAERSAYQEIVITRRRCWARLRR